jgi:probable lipoprotein NlpC
MYSRTGMGRASTIVTMSVLAAVLSAGCSSTVRFSTRPERSPERQREKNREPAPHEKNAVPDSAIGDSGLVSRCFSYLGTPYRWGGMSHAGVDCSGLVCLVFKQAAGMALPRDAREQHKLGRKIPLAKVQPGDLLFFSTGFWPGISHVGIYTRNGRFIHASSSRGVIESSLDDQYYRYRFVEARRIFR